MKFVVAQQAGVTPNYLAKELAMIRLFTFAVALVCALVSLPSHAGERTLGQWEVHYNALRSTFIRPEIAAQYNLQRSRYQALVNIAVLDATQAGKPALNASLSGYALNGIGNRLQLKFTTVREGDAIYYLAQVPYTNQETLHFVIDISVAGVTQQLKFSQQLYTDA